jgi:hypothetical protein
MFSPNSFATLLRFFMETNPALSSSNNLKTYSPLSVIPTLLMSSLVSLSLILAVIISKNSLSNSSEKYYSKSIAPLLFLSRSEIIWKIVWFLASNPRLCMAALSSFGSIDPDPSVSNKSNASFISSISSSVNPGLSYLTFEMRCVTS